MRRWRQASAANWSKTIIFKIRIHKTGRTYLSKLMKIDVAVAPGLSSKLEQDNHCCETDPHDWYHIPFYTGGNR
jgi:hypothetical protein